MHTATRASRRASNDVVRGRPGGDNGRQRRRNSGCSTTREKEERDLHAVADVTAPAYAARERRSNAVGRPPRMLSRDDVGTPTPSTQRAPERGALPATAIPFPGTQWEGRVGSNTTPFIGEAYGSLRPETGVARETCRAEDVEDVSGRSSRDVHRGRSLGKIWPSSSKPPPPPSAAGKASEEEEAALTSTDDEIRVGLRGPEAQRAGTERNNRRAVPSEGAPAAATAENELSIFAVLGAPSGVDGAAEGIERRLAVLTGKLAMPRGVSSRVR
ncbi:unnamed protein product [Scytosiphon promiscuus]